MAGVFYFYGSIINFFFFLLFFSILQVHSPFVGSCMCKGEGDQISFSFNA